jgi:3-oxoadipate enol-lactonase
MAYASWDDVRLHYQVTGEGTPVLLLMGFAMRGAAWRFQIPTLAKSHQVCAFDNRGAGDTECAARPYSTRIFADDACRLMDHLGWERAHIVGVSMGGMIAQELTLRSPERVKSLTLVATHAGGTRARLPRRRGVVQFWRAQRGKGERARGAAVAKLLFPDHFLAQADPGWVEAVLRDDFGSAPAARYQLSQYAAILKHDTRRRLRGLNAPTLVVKPEDDSLINPRESDRLHRLIPDARLLSIQGAGHGVIRQCADELNAALLGHFARVEGTAG